MPSTDFYESRFDLIRRALTSEDPPNEWSYFVFCTYNHHLAEKYAHLLPETIPDESFLGSSPTAPSAFDKFVVNRFRSYIDAYFKFYLPNPGSDEFHAKMNLDFVRMNGGASFDEARKHLHKRLVPEDDEDAPYLNRYQIFVVIDDESLQSMLEGPAPLTKLEVPLELDSNGAMGLYREKTRGEKEMFVKVVDADYEEDCEGIITMSKGRGEPLKDSPDATVFYGWIKACPRSLFMLIGDLEIYDSLTGVFNTVDKSDCLYSQI